MCLLRRLLALIKNSKNLEINVLFFEIRSYFVQSFMNGSDSRRLGMFLKGVFSSMMYCLAYTFLKIFQLPKQAVARCSPATPSRLLFDADLEHNHLQFGGNLVWGSFPESTELHRSWPSSFHLPMIY